MERVPAVRNCPAIARDEGDPSYRYRPTMSRTLSMKSGSRLSLKVSAR